MVPGLPQIRLHIATPTSGLRQLVEAYGGDTPYWAYPWAGGLALARYILDHPKTVEGRRVLDLGSGSGMVAIAAGLAGASSVIAAEIDLIANAAIQLNADANGITLDVQTADIVDSEPPEVDLIVGGDVFYSGDVALRMTAFFDRCLEAGTLVIIGDPGRQDLPSDRLQFLAEYDVGDFALGVKKAKGFVYKFQNSSPDRIPHHIHEC